ncbi:MAG: methanol--corrinoid methyltransferase [Candidatus Marinimicrobia bacterium]|nr:methanol--corrinoid methyltransferase [Candidatus Neomarinimicrobiota bacterium]
MQNKYNLENLVISKPEELIFGTAPHPVECGHGLVIGGGQVYPEINFTLPSMTIEEKTWKEVRKQYTTIIEEVCQRAVTLESSGIVVEFELLPPMTINPEWGAEITQILRNTLDDFYEKEGLRSALRVTPVDVRDSERPPRMRSGKFWEKTYQSFEKCAEAGADMLSIESTGGKEVHDEALVHGDLAGLIFALGSLGVRDMGFLWSNIVEISARHDVIPAGDTACGFANTAMVLAEKKMIPRVLAAVDRVASVARTLQGHLEGALGPTKDCAYEGPYIKALTGVPISMEGRTSACAHLSTIGNVAGACCDMWSNESVQNVRLLSANAPVVSLEQLIYDCRLYNTAIAEGKNYSNNYRRLLIESDIHRDPQAYVLDPEVVIKISQKLINCDTPLAMTFKAVKETINIIEKAYQDKELELNKGDVRWLGLLKNQLGNIPKDESSLLERIQSSPLGDKFLPQEYGI